MDAERLLLTPAEAARRLSLAQSTVYQLLLTRQLVSIKIGRSRRIPMDALTAYIDRLRRVARHQSAKCVVLAEWKKGKQPTLFRLKRVSIRDGGLRSSWAEVTNVDKLLA